MARGAAAEESDPRVGRVTMATFRMRYDGLDWLVHVLHDGAHPTPWQEYADGEVIQVRAIGVGVKRPGEVMLNDYLAADFAGALAQVRAEGRGVEATSGTRMWATRLFGAEVSLTSLTRRQQAALAARLTIERWRAWCRAEWTHVAVGAQLLNLDGEVVDDENGLRFTIGGVASDDEEGIRMAARDAADDEVATYDVVKVAMMRAINLSEENDDGMGTKQSEAADDLELR